MRQIEVSRTLVFDAPRRARAFFEALVERQPRHRPPRQRRVHLHRTAPSRGAVQARLRPQDQGRHPRHRRDRERLLQAFPGQAVPQRRPRTADRDRGQLTRRPRAATAGWQHLDELQTKARAVNRRLLDTERVGQGCVLASPAFERVALPTLTADGRRAPALRFGDPRVMALLGALCVSLNALGFTNRSLRAQVSRLLGAAYTINQMSYDLGRLRLNGLIERRPHQHLHPDPRRATRRDLLHQGPRPAPPTTTRRDTTTRTDRCAPHCHHRHTSTTT